MAFIKLNTRQEKLFTFMQQPFSQLSHRLVILTSSCCKVII